MTGGVGLFLPSMGSKNALFRSPLKKKHRDAFLPIQPLETHRPQEAFALKPFWPLKPILEKVTGKPAKAPKILANLAPSGPWTLPKVLVPPSEPGPALGPSRRAR